jgi:branched-chain amino acid transport system ATP-binding protein
MPGILETKSVSAGYGKKRVLRGVSLDVSERAIVAIIGHNGAGKSTLLHTIFGLLTPTAGKVFYSGREVTRERAAEKLKHGMILIPQGRNVFGDLTVSEHLQLVTRSQAYDESVDTTLTLFPDLKAKLSVKAGSLSGGQRQMLAIACGVLRRPRLMLIDEPSIGLAPILVKRVLQSLSAMRDQHGVTIVVVEQNVKRVLEIADYVYAIRSGEIIYSGSGERTRKMDSKALWEYL